MSLILQAESSYEVRAILAYALTRDIAAVRARAADLRQAQLAHLRAGLTPIGSVEFVRLALEALRLPEPLTISYPDALEPWLGRKILRLTLKDLPGERPIFIKPAGHAKLFSGFVLNDPARSEYAQEQVAKLGNLLSTTPVYACEPIRFISEWRYYVLEGKIIGCTRYDDGSDEAPGPERGMAQSMVDAFGADGTAPVAYALDVGVTEAGQTVLVEANDAWALGLYRGMDVGGYLEMLQKRWAQILAEG